MNASINIGFTEILFDDVKDAEKAFKALRKGNVIRVEEVKDRGDCRFHCESIGISLKTNVEEPLPVEALEMLEAGRWPEWQEIENLSPKERAERERTKAANRLQEILGDYRKGIRSPTIPAIFPTRKQIADEMPADPDYTLQATGSEQLDPLCDGRR